MTAATSADALAGWADEMRSAYLYRIVADAERGSPREKLFRGLAGEAESQAAIWAESARKQGAAVPPRYVTSGYFESSMRASCSAIASGVIS